MHADPTAPVTDDAKKSQQEQKSGTSPSQEGSKGGQEGSQGAEGNPYPLVEPQQTDIEILLICPVLHPMTAFNKNRDTDNIAEIQCCSCDECVHMRTHA